MSESGTGVIERRGENTALPHEMKGVQAVWQKVVPYRELLQGKELTEVIAPGLPLEDVEKLFEMSSFREGRAIVVEEGWKKEVLDPLGANTRIHITAENPQQGDLMVHYIRGGPGAPESLELRNTFSSNPPDVRLRIFPNGQYDMKLSHHTDEGIEVFSVVSEQEEDGETMWTIAPPIVKNK